MKVFVAGATGAIGRPLVARLLADGHEVVGTTRDESRAARLRELGVDAVVLDAFDAEALRAAIHRAEPEVAIHQLTALPAEPTPKAMAAALTTTARLRRETVPPFLAAAHEAGARRAIVQSISFVTRPDGRPVHDEDAPLDLGAGDVVAAVADMEAAAHAAAVETLVLRYGFLYGPGTWYARDGAIPRLVRRRRYPLIGQAQGRTSFVHVDDAADATIRALHRGAPGVYNVCDDEPAMQREWLPELARLLGAKPPRRVPPWLARRLAGDAVVHYAVSLPGNANGRAKQALDWSPPSWRERFPEIFA